MRCATKCAAGWCFALLVALSVPGPRAWAGAGSDRADGLCKNAATAERDAKEAERKSEERQRFLKGKGGIASRSDTFQSGEATAIRQSAKAKIAEVRALLPQLRQGAAAAARDRGIVPGLSQYFAQLESNLSRTLQAADACLDAPQYCTVPSISCPPVPGMPSFNHSGSAAFILQVQQSYAQSANQLRQACENLNAGILGDVERLKKDSRAAGTRGGLPGIAHQQPFGDTDLHLRRAENLRREASLSRQEADRISGIRGYCGSRSHFRMDAGTTHAVVEGLKAAERPRKPAADFPLNAKVIDLKSEWDRKWNKGTALDTSDVPLPKLQASDGGETAPSRAEDTPEENGPSWWDKTKSAYRKADEEMELTEFITSRPKELMKDGLKKIVEHTIGRYGESVVTGYTIQAAVKATADEVGGILVDAPGVIAYGGVADARKLEGRTLRVHFNTLNNLSTEVTPAPRDWSQGQ